MVAMLSVDPSELHSLAVRLDSLGTQLDVALPAGEAGSPWLESTATTARVRDDIDRARIAFASRMHMTSEKLAAAGNAYAGSDGNAAHRFAAAAHLEPG
ncbi:hypothetical protein ACPCIR_25750 [Mycobacterium sp. NPDC051198]